MTIALDLDGVLSDFTRAFLDAANEIWPKRFDNESQPIGWDMEGLGFAPGEIDLVWQHIKAQPNWWEQCHCYPESAAALKLYLTHRRFERPMLYVTSRCEVAGRSVAEQSRRWLRRLALFPPGKVIVSPSGAEKAHIYARNRVWLSIDDCLANVHAADGVRCYDGTPHKAYLLDRPWNRTGRRGNEHVVRNLAEFLSLADRKFE